MRRRTSWLFRKWKSHSDRRADAFVAFDANGAVVSIDNIAHSSEANSMTVRGASGIDGTKSAVENPGEVCEWNADAIIGYLEYNPRVLSPKGDNHAAIAWAVFQGVVEQVTE